MSGKKFLKGAAILSSAGLIVKIIGAIYRIPLTNLIGTEGIGYFQPAYQVYNLVLVVSLAGFPTAVARLVSERRALDRNDQAHKVFRVSLLLMIFLGVVTSAAIYIFAGAIAEMIGYPGTVFSLKALTPAILIVPVISVYRGYFQGMQNMVPTAISQVIEQIVRFATGLYLANLLIGNLPKAAGGASFGASAGGFAAFIFILFIYFSERKNIKSGLNLEGKFFGSEMNRTIKELLLIAVPITIGASIVPLMGIIDAKLVSLRLLQIGYSAKDATDMYGQLSGTAQTFINFPQVFSIAVAMSLVPVISESYTKKKSDQLDKLSGLGLRTALMIGLPSSFGLFILSEPIIKLFYPGLGPAKHESVGELLAILSISVIFLTIVQSLTAILQAIGKQKFPVKNLAAGAAAKIIFTYILVGIPSINIKGAAYSTIIAFFVAAVLNYYDLKRNTQVNIKLSETGSKTLLSSVIMAVAVYAVYHVPGSLIGRKLLTLLSVLAGIVTYSAALVLTGAITEEDLRYLPKGNPAVKIFKKFNKIKR